MNEELKRVPPIGPLGARIALLGEGPSYEEVEQGKPFVGASGRLLDALLREAGVRREEIWVTNACKYFVPPNLPGQKIPFYSRAKNVGVNMEEQLEELRTELYQIKPNVIIAVGGTALWALTGKTQITEWRGSILSGMGIKTVPTFHPANLLYQDKDGLTEYWHKPVIILDMKRAIQQSYFPDIIRPSRYLHVARNSADFYDFIQRHKGKTRPSVDIEAQECIPVCVGIAFTPEEGITIPLWNIKGISEMPDSDLTNLWIMLAKFLAEHEVVGQNFGYDRDKIKRLGLIVKRLASDTMLKSFCINPELPKNLPFNTSIYTEEPFYKNEGMYEGAIEDLFIGCARDACVTKEIDNKMEPELDQIGQREFYENFILKLHDLYRHIEGNGFKVNEDRREYLISKYCKMSIDMEYELFKLAGNIEINVQSPKQVAVFLYESLKIPRREGTGEEVLTQLLNNVVRDKEHRRAIELVLEKRRVEKTIGNYLMAPADYDGRMKTSYFPCLDTGRTSTTQLEPPIRPWVEFKDEKGKTKYKAIGTAFQTMTKHGDIGSDIRSMYECDEGDIFIQVDSSQAEARVVSLLSDDEDTLKMYDEHDLHALTASWFFGGSESDYSKKVLGYESAFRFAGKTLRHAGNLGASKRRAAIEVNTQARKYKIDYVITEKEAGNALDIFHGRTPNVRKVFHRLVIEQLQKNRTLIAPLPYGVKSKYGGRRMFFEKWSDELNRTAFAYLPQRTVSDNTKAAAMRILERAPWIKIIVEAHDALLISVPTWRKNEAGKILLEEMERPIDFSNCSIPRRSLVIPAELEEGYNYKELRKFKWEKEIEDTIESKLRELQAAI